MATKRRSHDWGLTEVEMPSKYTTDRKLWLTADRERVVEDGDPDAAFLLASKGKELDAATVERYGLEPKKQGGKPAKDDAAGTAEGKAVAGPPENKAVKAPATKGKE
jgi:hypothetical protein